MNMNDKRKIRQNRRENENESKINTLYVKHFYYLFLWLSS